jgi:class 3 adenylate cyclase/predicted ATPase
MAAMQQIADWLDKLGLSEYAQRFAENGIDVSVLRHLTDQDLEKVGVLLGHRRKMLAAIAELGGAAAATPGLGTGTEPRPQDAAERRQLTIMFCDLVGSTALSTRLDPEDLREIISAHHRRCAEVIVKHGGFVAKYMGDGVLAYFGYPRAHEDDAERAVRAGLALVGALTKPDTASGTASQVRVGIATGLVVVGDLMPDDPAHECEVVGETPNLAARLQTLAKPDAVVIDNNTCRLLGKLFEYRTLGPLSVKGFDDPVVVWQVTGVSAVDSRFEALRATTTPLIGREEEIDLLTRRWEQAKRGQGCVVLLSGEPGIGKSRIAQTVMEQLSGDRHTRLRYFCSPHHQESALHPSITQLERAAGFRRDDTDKQRLSKLEAVLGQGTNNLSETVPLLAELLSIPTGDRYPPLNLTPQKRKEKTLDAQLAQVEGLAARQPVLMVFEDVQWSDPTTRESLDLLIDRVPTLRVLAVITFRPGFTPPWVGRPHVTLLSLSRLPPRQSAEMITHITGGKVLPKEIGDQIIDRTDGVPLFIEELTKAVLESGLLAESGDRYLVTGPVTPPAIPTSLQASLLARLDRLAPAREVAQIAAALGRQFSHELISAVAAMPRQHLDVALTQLVDAELIFRRGTPPDAEYTFKHALVQDTAYSTILRGRRHQLHARIAGTLESQFPEVVETRPELLARHCTEAGLVEKAVGYWLKAGQRTLARSAMVESVAQLRKGLDLVSRVPDSTLRFQHELDLQTAVGSALIATKGYAAKEVGQAFARARHLCEQLNQPTVQFVRALNGEWAHHLIRAELGLARQRAAQMRQLGESGNSAALKWLGCLASGHTSLKFGEFPAARRYLERGIASIDPVHRPRDAAVGLMSLSCALGFLGHLDQARVRRDEALAEARKLSHAYTLALALTMGLHLEHGVSSVHSLLQLAEETIVLSAEQGFPFCWATATMYSGWCLVALGQGERGLALFKQGLVAYRATGAVLDLPLALIVLADALGRARQPEEGLKRLAEAAPAIDATDDRFGEADLYRVRGDLLKSIGDHAAAEQSLFKALAVARFQSAKLWELRAALDLARLWRDRGRSSEARGLLAPLYGWFTEGFDTPVLQDAKALLDELAS